MTAGRFMSPFVTMLVALAIGAAGACVAESAETGSHPQPRESGWAQKMTRSRTAPTAQADPFASRSWVAAPKVAPAPPPGVPPFPYRFFGRMVQQEGRATVFLTKGDALYTATSGDVLDGTYRIEHIREDGLDVLYVPLQKTQRIEYVQITAPSAPLYAQAGAGGARGTSDTGRAPGFLRREDLIRPVESTRTIETAREAPAAEIGSPQGGTRHIQDDLASMRAIFARVGQAPATARPDDGPAPSFPQTIGIGGLPGYAKPAVPGATGTSVFAPNVTPGQPQLLPSK